LASPVAVLNARLLSRARLRHLQLLVAVADHGTLKRAAARVGVSQPAATQALSELERLLEVPLFERHARGMRASEAGRIVLPVVRRMLQALEASVEAMTAQLAGASGLLRVGTIPAAAVALVAPRLHAIVTRHPHLRLRLIEGTPSHLLNEVAVGSLDVVLTRQPAELGTRFLFEPLARDEAIVIAGSNHPLAGRARVSLDELASYPWMLPPAGVRVRELLEGLLAGCPAITAHPVSTSSPSLVVCVLADQRTLTLGPISAAEPYIRQGLVTRLRLPRGLPLAELGAVYPAASRDEPALAAFLGALREASKTEWRVPGAAPNRRARRKG
jgi:DNA-binding transcriptional LysR family regulator